jgi:hypothetical protein
MEKAGDIETTAVPPAIEDHSEEADSDVTPTKLE